MKDKAGNRQSASGAKQWVTPGIGSHGRRISRVCGPPMKQMIKVHSGGSTKHGRRFRFGTDRKVDKASRVGTSGAEGGHKIRISKPASDTREPVF